MLTFVTFVLIYLLGGLTFLPLVVTALYLHWQNGSKRTSKSGIDTDSQSTSSTQDLPELPTELPEELKKYVQGRRHEADVAAGYFAVCREYVPGGVNGKPPERTTPAGAVIATESPSVYQSMYRGIFGRDKTAAPTIQSEPGKGNKVKKGRNVFYVVLRLGHLMLYDDAEQLEVRHVISLAHHGVDIYGGGETIPEGELFVKRNCIRLTSRRVAGELSTESRPFFLFSDNCSEKEDFYHALLQNQERREGSPDNPPRPLQFEQAHLIKLVQQLHASEENLQTRWFNALLGRVFLSMYKTVDVESFIRSKINKKISRVQKPNFISSITVGKMSMGDAAPIFTNPKLRELTMAGDVTAEADVKYNGGFRIEISAVARIDLGKRMGGVRELNLLLAAVAKQVEGHVLFRIKPPPSNRIWFSFETAPKMEISIEPIVAQRQITYGFILRAIESRIREVLAETLVFPNWDDVPFHQTLLQRFRGGIWEDDVRADAALPTGGLSGDDAAQYELQQNAGDEPDTFGTPQLLPDKGKTMSAPFLANTAPIGLTQRNRAASRTGTDLSSAEAAISSGIDTDRSGQPITGESKPKALRSNSFAVAKAAEPMLHSEPITIDSKARSTSGGSLTLKGINAHQSLSRSNSPRDSPVGSPERNTETADIMRQAMRSSKGSVSSVRSNLSGPSDADTAASREELGRSAAFDGPPSSPPARMSLDSVPPGLLSHSRNSSADLVSATDSISSADKEPELLGKQAKRATTLKMLGSNASDKRQSLNAAAAAAKRWGLGVIAARQNAKGSGAASVSSRPSTATSSEEHEVAEDHEPTQDEEASEAPVEAESADTLASTPTSSRSSRIIELGKDIDRAPSPSLIPRRISSTHSVSSASSTSTNKANRQSSPQTSKIPVLPASASNNSLGKSLLSTTSSSPSISPSNFSNPSLAPSQQEIESRLQLSHSRSPSTGVSHGPGSPSMPIGRGQPLPPPGKPLPGPKTDTWVGAAGAMLSGMRRRPVGSSRNGSVDEGRPQRKAVNRQELDAKRKQYEQEKHIIGTSPVEPEGNELSSEHANGTADEDDRHEHASSSPAPPPLPQRPAATAPKPENDEKVNGLEHSAGPPPLPKRASSIPVTKRPVPKPPLPARKPQQPNAQSDKWDFAVPIEGYYGDEAAQGLGIEEHGNNTDRHHEQLEKLEPAAVLRDEEELADEHSSLESTGEDEEEEVHGDLETAADLEHDVKRDEVNLIGLEDEDDETFGPMEMNVPESPVTGKDAGLEGHPLSTVK